MLANPVLPAIVSSPEALSAFLAAWEKGTLPKPEWTHAAHVAAVACYAFRLPAEEVMPRMKAGILHYNACVGTANTEDSGYHESLTRLWSDVVGTFVRQGNFADEWEAVRAAVAAFGPSRDLHKRYWTHDIVRDRVARREWVAPDLIPEGVSDSEEAGTARRLRQSRT